MIGFQDIRSLAFLRERPALLFCQQVPAAPAFTPVPDQLRREFEVAISAGIGVAAGAQSDDRLDRTIYLHAEEPDLYV